MNEARSACGCIIGPGPWCGTLGGYTNHQCHCDGCTLAHREHALEYQRGWRAKNIAAGLTARGRPRRVQP